MASTVTDLLPSSFNKVVSGCMSMFPGCSLWAESQWSASCPHISPKMYQKERRKGKKERKEGCREKEKKKLNMTCALLKYPETLKAFSKDMYIRPGTSTQQEPGAHTWLFLDWIACLYRCNEMQARTHSLELLHWPNAWPEATWGGSSSIWHRVRECSWPLQAGPRGSWLCSDRNNWQFLLTSQQIRTQRGAFCCLAQFSLFFFYSVWDPSPWDGAVHIQGGYSALN